MPVPYERRLPCFTLSAHALIPFPTELQVDHPLASASAAWFQLLCRLSPWPPQCWLKRPKTDTNNNAPCFFWLHSPIPIHQCIFKKTTGTTKESPSVPSCRSALLVLLTHASIFFFLFLTRPWLRIAYPKTFLSLFATDSKRTLAYCIYRLPVHLLHITLLPNCQSSIHQLPISEQNDVRIVQ